MPNPTSIDQALRNAPVGTQWYRPGDGKKKDAMNLRKTADGKFIFFASGQASYTTDLAGAKAFYKAQNLNNANRPLIKINHTDITLDDSIREYAIPTFSGLDIDPAGDMIVEINGELLKTVETTYKIYDGNNAIPIGLDTPRDPGTVIFTDLRVFIDDVIKTFGIDYVFTSENNTVTLIKPVKLGAVIRIEDSSGRQYSISGTSLVLEQTTEFTTGDTLSITWFERYTELDIVKDEFVGGKVSFSLQRPL